MCVAAWLAWSVSQPPSPIGLSAYAGTDAKGRHGCSGADPSRRRAAILAPSPSPVDHHCIGAACVDEQVACDASAVFQHNCADRSRSLLHRDAARMMHGDAEPDARA